MPTRRQASPAASKDADLDRVERLDRALRPDQATDDGPIASSAPPSIDDELPAPELQSGGTAGSPGPLPEVTDSTDGRVGDPMESFDRQRARRSDIDGDSDPRSNAPDDSSVVDQIQDGIRHVVEMVFGGGAAPLVLDPTDAAPVESDPLADEPVATFEQVDGIDQFDVDQVAEIIGAASEQLSPGGIEAAVGDGLSDATDDLDDQFDALS